MFNLDTLQLKMESWKIRTWWQAFIPGKSAFGFSSTDGKIDEKFPDYNLVGKNLSDCRWWFTSQGYQVTKIGETLCTK